MRYLKKFESLFGTAEPERITYDDFYPEKTPRASFTEKELLYLESLFERNGKKIGDVEYNKGATFMYSEFTLDKEEFPNNFMVSLYSNTQNGEPIYFECYKHLDDWYDVCISQANDEYDEDLFNPGFTEYWRCDEFDSLKKLLDKWI
jgi:hypothetical protein